MWAGPYYLVTLSDSPASRLPSLATHRLEGTVLAAIPSPMSKTPPLRPVIYCQSCNAASHSRTCGCATLSARARQGESPASILASLAEARLCIYCGEGLPCECKELSARDRSRKAVEHSIRVKYAKVLRVPEWDATELRDLAPLLREAVLVSAQASEVVKTRLQFSELARAYGL